MREQIGRFGGREIETVGDVVVAIFDGPGRALRSAVAIVRAVGDLGIELRAGIDTGEIELAGDGISGIAVHIAARVVSAAAPSRVWVTGTVRELVIGSNVDFVDRGSHRLKGVPGEWRMHEVVPASIRTVETIGSWR